MIRMNVIGHLGQDAVIRDGRNAQDKAISFSVAHSEKYKNAQGVNTERTTWVQCTFWRTADKLAIAQYLKKGQKVFVTGKPDANGYTDAKGQVNASLHLNVLQVELLKAANGQQQPASNYNAPQLQPQVQQSDISNDDGSDLPF